MTETDSSAGRGEVGKAEVVEQLRALGVTPGGVLIVHISFRATRPVEGGPLGLIEALRDALGPEGTLVMPSWTDDDDDPFDPASTPVAADLGAVADSFWRQPGVRRGAHCFAFAALGPEAERIVAGPRPVPPHIPDSAIGRVHALDGQVLMLGCGHEADTMLHLAESMAGVPYRVMRHYTELQDGEPVRVAYGENDHCCERFALADDWLREEGLQAEGPVANTDARLARAKDIVELALERLAQEPLLFLHPESALCADCNEARSSIG